MKYYVGLIKGGRQEAYSIGEARAIAMKELSRYPVNQMKCITYMSPFGRSAAGYVVKEHIGYTWITHRTNDKKVRYYLLNDDGSIRTEL